MSKIIGLYCSYIKEREKEFNDFSTGGIRMENLQNFLKQKLNAEDYFIAEEMLNDLAAEIEQKGFEAGAKYTAGLGMELISDK